VYLARSTFEVNSIPSRLILTTLGGAGISHRPHKARTDEFHDLALVVGADHEVVRAFVPEFRLALVLSRAHLEHDLRAKARLRRLVELALSDAPSVRVDHARPALHHAGIPILVLAWHK